MTSFSIFLCRKLEVFDIRFAHTSEAMGQVFDSPFRYFTLMHNLIKTFEKKIILKERIFFQKFWLQ